MATVRTVKRENPFVQLDKGYIGNGSLSLKATGLLTYILSKPDGWQIRMSDIEKRFKDGETSIRTAMSELMEMGYVHRYRERDDKGRLGDFVYEVYERPEFNPNRTSDADNEPKRENHVQDDEPKRDFPGQEKPRQEKPRQENHVLSNNDFSNNDFSNNDFSSSSSNVREDDLNSLVTYYQQNYQLIMGVPPAIQQDMEIVYDRFGFDDPFEVIRHAVQLAIRAERKWNYAFACLKNWKASGYKTMEQIELHDKRFRQEVNNRKGTNTKGDSNEKHKQGSAREYVEKSGWREELKRRESLPIDKMGF